MPENLKDCYDFISKVVKAQVAGAETRINSNVAAAEARILEEVRDHAADGDYKKTCRSCAQENCGAHGHDVDNWERCGKWKAWPKRGEVECTSCSLVPPECGYLWHSCVPCPGFEHIRVRNCEPTPDKEDAALAKCLNCDLIQTGQAVLEYGKKQGAEAERAKWEAWVDGRPGIERTTRCIRRLHNWLNSRPGAK